MKKTILIIILFALCVSISSAGVTDKLRAVIAAKNAGGADVTAPTWSSTTVATDGDAVTVVFSENLNDTALGGGEFDLDCDGVSGADNVLVYSSGDGTNTWVFAATSTVQSGESCTTGFDGAANEAEDDAGNDLADYGPEAVTNNSTQGGASYLVEESFDGSTSCASGEPSNCDNTWVEEDDSGGTADDFDCSAGDCGLVGTYSYSSPDPVSGQNKIRLDFGARDEVWAAFMWYVTTQADSATTIFRIKDTTPTDVGNVEWGNGLGISVDIDGGFTVSDRTAQTALSGNLYYVKIRFKKGTGNNAEMELWLSNNTTSWGTSVSSTDGDATNQVQWLLFSNYYAADMAWVVDKIVIDDEDIPITYFQ